MSYPLDPAVQADPHASPPRRNGVTTHPAQEAHTLADALRAVAEAGDRYRLALPPVMYRDGGYPFRPGTSAPVAVAEIMPQSWWGTIKDNPATLMWQPVLDLVGASQVGTIAYRVLRTETDQAPPNVVIPVVYVPVAGMDVPAATMRHNEMAVRAYQWHQIDSAARQSTARYTIAQPFPGAGRWLGGDLIDEVPEGEARDGASDSVMISQPVPGVRILSEINAGEIMATDPLGLRSRRQHCDLCGYTHGGGVWVAFDVPREAVKGNAHIPRDLTLDSLVYLVQHIAAQEDALEQLRAMGLHTGHETYATTCWVMTMISDWASQLLETGLDATVPAWLAPADGPANMALRLATLHGAIRRALGLATTPNTQPVNIPVRYPGADGR